MKGFTTFDLNPKTRERLLEEFPPVHPDVIATHIRVEMNVREDAIPAEPETVDVVGHAVNDSVETLLVKIDGSTDRGDGGLWHITWSIDRSKGAKPFHSNKLLEDEAMINRVPRTPICVTPAWHPHNR